MPNGNAVAYALIDGVLQRYDVCIDSIDGVFKIDDNMYEYIGRGVIDSICGLPNYSKKLMFFYRKIEIKKKRYY